MITAVADGLRASHSLLAKFVALIVVKLSMGLVACYSRQGVLAKLFRAKVRCISELVALEVGTKQGVVGLVVVSTWVET